MNIEELIKRLRGDIRFNAEQKESVRSRLLRFMEAHDAIRADSESGYMPQRPRGLALSTKPLPMPVMAIIVILALAGGGTSFAAEQSLPGDILYPVKVHLNENIVAGLAFTAKDRAKVETNLAARRLEEAAMLAQNSHMNAEVKTELENNFETHAANAKQNIHEIEAQGNLAGAANAASDFEGLLQAHEAVLGRIESEHDGEERSDIKPIRAKVRVELEDLAQRRGDLEIKVSEKKQDKEENRAELGAAVRARLDAAANVIADAEEYIQSKKRNLGTDAVVQAEAQMKVANDFITQGRTKLAEESYSEALALANRAIRVAGRAKFLMNANAELNIRVEIGHDENNHDIGGNEIGTSSTEQKSNEIDSTTSPVYQKENDNHSGASSSAEIKSGDDRENERAHSGLQVRTDESGGGIKSGSDNSEPEFGF